MIVDRPIALCARSLHFFSSKWLLDYRRSNTTLSRLRLNADAASLFFNVFRSRRAFATQPPAPTPKSGHLKAARKVNLTSRLRPQSSATSNAPSDMQSAEIPGMTDKDGRVVITSRAQLVALLAKLEGTNLQIENADEVLKQLGLTDKEIAGITMSKEKVMTEATRGGSGGDGGGKVAMTKSEQSDSDASAKLPTGLGAAYTFLVIMATIQGIFVIKPEVWQKYFAVNMPSVPPGSEVQLNPFAIITNAFAPSSMVDWIVNSYVSFFAVRSLAIVFGNFTTLSLVVLFATWANRALFIEAEKTDMRATPAVDDKEEGQKEYYRGLSKATANATLVFSLAAFAGCIFPNAFVPLIPIIGPCPLLALPCIGVLTDVITIIRQDKPAENVQYSPAEEIWHRLTVENSAHLYGAVAGFAAWFFLARWTRMGQRVRSQSRGLQIALSKQFTPDKPLWKFFW
ncbi:uncharacterized protein V1518DRAFT_421350 [Limtongia smithiae]|uniref:uncharacterized protein n=1 Tax=Limtongia smithiae TaxID=1125753 RepID=UPI0034CE533B